MWAKNVNFVQNAELNVENTELKLKNTELDFSADCDALGAW